MRTTRFRVLSQREVECIHSRSMEVLATVGIKVDYQTARDLFRQAGAGIDDELSRVRIPEELVRWALDQAPDRFTLHDADSDLQVEIGGGEDPALKYATSLGRAHSLLFYYPTDTHIDGVPYLSPAQKQRVREWMGDGIVRVSVGLENAQDLIADLDQALRGRTPKGLIAPLAYRLLAGQ